MATMEVLQKQLADALAERDTLELSVQAVTAERDTLETAYAQLVTTIRDGERFPPDHDHLAAHAANLQAARNLAGLDTAAMLRDEVAALRAQLAAISETAAAEQRLRAKGASDEDIATLKRR